VRYVWEVDGTGSGSLPMAGFGISGVEASCSANWSRLVLAPCVCDLNTPKSHFGRGSVDRISNLGLPEYGAETASLDIHIALILDNRKQHFGCSNRTLH